MATLDLRPPRHPPAPDGDRAASADAAADGAPEREPRTGPRPAKKVSPPPVTDDAVELELRRIGLGSVAKVTLFFGATTTALWVGAVALLWVAAAGLGATESLERLVRDLGFEGFRIELGPVFLAVLLTGSVWVTALVVLAFVFAASYNAFAAVFGGLRCAAAPYRGGRLLVVEPTRDAVKRSASHNGRDPDPVAVPNGNGHVAPR